MVTKVRVFAGKVLCLARWLSFKEHPLKSTIDPDGHLSLLNHRLELLNRRKNIKLLTNVKRQLVVRSSDPEYRLQHASICAFLQFAG